MNFLKLLCLFVFIQAHAIAAPTIIKGTVRDNKTGEKLSFVTVSFIGTDIGNNTDQNGYFELRTDQKVDSFRVFMVGYKPVVRPVSKGAVLNVDIALEEASQMLREVAVHAAHTRYRNKDNPAVALIRKVIDHKEANYKKPVNSYSYNKYEKVGLSLIRSADNSHKKYNAVLVPLFKDADSTKLEGKLLVPFLLQEQYSQYYYDANNNRGKDVILGEKKTSLDEILDDDGLQAYVDKIYAQTDIYDNNITIGDQQFLSPAAGLGPTFYKYFITDTLKDVQPWQVQLEFYPRNNADVLFKGKMWIALDSTYAIQSVELGINKNISLNWVDALNISMKYERNKSGGYYLRENRLGMSMSIFKNKGGIYGERIVSLNNYKTGISIPDSIFRNKEEETFVPQMASADWDEVRGQSLSSAEVNVYANLDTLKKSKGFKRTANILTLLFSGYEDLGPVEIGPVNSFYSFNPVEGFRLKLGGRTTEDFSKKLMLEGHLAYGFKDKQWKYAAGVSYALSKSLYKFPIRALSLRYSYETQIPGQGLTFLEEDNFLLSFKRGANDKWLYNRQWTLEYYHETQNHLSFRAGFSNITETPGGSLAFRLAKHGIEQPSLTLSEFTGEVRWAPHEQFYQGKKYRRPIFNSYPIFTLRGTVGVKGLMGGAYNYQSITLNIFKRFYLSKLGFSDVVLEGGRIFGNVPYPVLYIHKANQTYAYQLQSYNLMNFMEFASDRYASLSIDHSFNGFFLNKIPLVKKLQLREVASFKALYGTIGDMNLPEYNGKLFDFPEDKQHRRLTHRLDHGPYIEASLGLSNIFKILRVDVVKRFTYLNHPGVAEWGIRARMVLAL